MKKLAALLLFLCAGPRLYAQISEAEKLSVPPSSAFKLVDLSPTLTETPATPKAFGLGVLQSFSGDGWPQDYSAQFTPYWWLLPKNRNVYRYIGIKRTTDAAGKETWRNNPFSAFKFTSISIAFIKKDMIPDTAALSQKVFSIGFRSTIVRAYGKAYTKKLHAAVDTLTRLQQQDILNLVNADTAYTRALLREDTATVARVIREYASRKNESLAGVMTRVKEQLAARPLFQWDAAGAYAAYGMADTAWRTGRGGVWSTASLNAPLNPDQTNYFSVAAYARYMYDAYALEKDRIISANSFDVGGRLSLEFDPVSVGVEAVYRNYVSAQALKSQRLVGYVNYRIGKALYINGAFGNDFGMDKSRILALFGLNWGLGSERLDMSGLTEKP